MTRKTLLDSEGWRSVPGKPLRCTCPWCGDEVSSNAYARKIHKQKCPSWKTTTDAAAPTARPGSAARAAEQPPGVRPSRDAAMPAPNDLVRKPAATNLPPLPPPALRWTLTKVAGAEQWTAWRDDARVGLQALRVQRVGMRAAPDFTSYAERKYVGSFRTPEAAMSAAENYEEDR